MEHIRFFMGILLAICLIFYLNTQKASSVINELEVINNKDNICPLGLVVKDFKGKVRVEDVLEYTPAKNAGIEVGDKIIKINDTQIANTKDFFEILESPHENPIFEIVIYRPHCNSKFPLKVYSTGE